MSKLLARLGLWGVILVTMFSFALAQRTQLPQKSPQVSDEALKVFLRSYLTPKNTTPDTTTRIIIAPVKTGGGETEKLVVYVTGQRWCGSGGCVLIILEPNGQSFKVLGRVTVVQRPIRLMSSAEGGRPDIGVRVHGGGMLPGYDAILSFDGNAYPRNASLPPARRVMNENGREIISNTQDGILLFVRKE